MTLGVVSSSPAVSSRPACPCSSACRCGGACRRPAAALGDLGFVPLVYAAGAGAVAAGGLVASWLQDDDWSVGEYNSYMKQMYENILAWDKIGWAKGCWNDKARRARWVAFMNAFGTHYGAHGKVSGFLSDSEEKPARDFMRQFANWGAELNAKCGTELPNPTPAPDPYGGGGGSGGGGGGGGGGPAKPTDWGAVAKWSALGIGGIVLLSLAGTVRSAFSSR